MLQPDPIPLPPANIQEPPDPPQPEEPAPMLDVHPPHHAANTWRDFFIHIATIVLGLCIAVGLEQTVEYLHRRHQVADARAALQLEERQNIRRFGLQSRYFHDEIPADRGNLAILLYLRAHPHAPAASWPGVFDWRHSTMPYGDAAWKTALQDGVVEHMLPDEVQRYTDIYNRLALIREDALAERNAFETTRGFLIRDPDPSHLTPAELDKALADMTNMLVLHLRTAGEQTRMTRRHPEFSPPPSPEDVRVFLDLNSSPEYLAGMKAADRELKEIDEMK